MFRLFITIVFSATFGFAVIGLAAITVSAAWEAMCETVMDDGTTFQVTVDEAKDLLKQIFVDPVEGIDVKQAIKEDVKVLNQHGKETVNSIKSKAEKLINDLQEIKDYVEE